jgi:hypothetical protein
MSSWGSVLLVGIETVCAINGRKSKMTDWKVFYRDDLDQDRTSRSIQSEESALEQARQLYLKERAQIYRIEGSDGRILRREEIMRWLSANKGHPILY